MLSTVAIFRFFSSTNWKKASGKQFKKDFTLRAGYEITERTIDKNGQKRDVKRRRLRTVISNLIMMAGHVTSHARQLVMGLGKSNVWRQIFDRSAYSRMMEDVESGKVSAHPQPYRRQVQVAQPACLANIQSFQYHLISSHFVHISDRDIESRKHKSGRIQQKL